MNAIELVVFFTGGTIGMDAAPGQAGAAPGNNQGRIFNALPAHLGAVQALAAGADGSLYILADGALLKATLEP